MSSLAFLLPRTVVRMRAIAHAQVRATGAVIQFPVALTVPENLFAKAAPGFGQATRGANGGLDRWITLNPTGIEGQGHPVKIHESATEKGTWHVIGGAAGKLNYLKLTGVKSPEEYKAHAKAKKEAARETKQRDLDKERERKAGLSEDERKAEAEQAREKARVTEEARRELRTRQQEHVAAVAKALGWKDEDWKFDRTRLEKVASPQRIDKLEAQHEKRMYERAQDAIRQGTRALLADRDRAAAALGHAPLTSDDPQTVALTDVLEPPSAKTGKGYRSITKESSDDEIRAALAGADRERLATELADAQAAVEMNGADAPVDVVATVKDLRAQIHTAELLEKAATLTPAAIAERKTAVAMALKDVNAARTGYQGELGELREAARAGTLDPKGQDRLTALEDQFRDDVRRDARLREEAIDLAVMAGESVAPAVTGEKTSVRAKRQAEREAEIRAEHGEPGVQAYRAMREKLRAGSERYQQEMRLYRETGALPPTLAPPSKPIDDPQHLLEMIARQKALTKMERELGQAKDDPAKDLKMFGKGMFTDVGTPTPAMIAEAERDVGNQLREQQTRAFLSKAESPELLLGRGGRFDDTTDARALGRAMERHLSSGAFNALNTAALAATKTPVLTREVVDVLGAGGAAQLLVHTLAQQEKPATLKAMAAKLGDYHLQTHVTEADERVREAEEALDRADEAIAAITSPSEIAVALEANQRRQAALEDARQILGTALGEYEATAALVQALGEGAPKEIHTNLGPVGTETAIRQLRALGLAREDYVISSDGTNEFATIRPSGFAKFAKPVDPAAVALSDDVMAIKRGERDEKDWTPAGTVVRTGTSFTTPGLEPPPMPTPPIADRLRAPDAKPADVVREHIALRAANGEDPNDILADLHQRLIDVPEQQRAGVAAEINRVFPLMQPLVEHGKPVYATDREGNVRKDADGKPVPKLVPTKADVHDQAVRTLTAEYFRSHGLNKSADIASQAITNDPKTHEAVTRALAHDPRAVTAFTPLGSLTSQDQRALRHYFASDVAKTDAASGYDAKAVETKIAGLGPEPTKATKGLFGTEETTPQWLDWKRQRDAIVAEHHGTDDLAPKTTAWPEYVTAMGGTANAYAALQDRLKSSFVRQFHQAYTTLHDQPLRIGTRAIANAERHAGYLDPATRAAMLAQHRTLVDEARTRVQGQYATGSALEKLGRLQQADEIARQNQMSLLGASPTAPGRKEPGNHERYTLGQTVEGQLAALMPNYAKTFKPNGPATPLLKDVRWTGAQQRAIKMFRRAKRMSAALSTGTGKTFVGVGAFSDLRNDPSTGVKRALYVVPSSVVGQFGSEFTRLIKPGSMTWAANPGATGAQRLAEHSDPNVHAVVHTLEGFREDMHTLLAKHYGISPDEARATFMALDRKSAATVMRDVWKQNGIDYQMVMADEAHTLLDRDGKPDSLLSHIVQAASDNTPYYLDSSADTIKNDVSELRSKLDKLNPDGRYADAGEWKRRYGVQTTAAAEALKREVAPYIFAASTPTGNKITRRRAAMPLHPEQQKQYAAVMDAFSKLGAARARGTVDVAAARQLAPNRFATAPAEQHETIAREIQRNPGVFKEEALRRVVDEAPKESNAKIQYLLSDLKAHPPKDAPAVVFAHRLKGVDEITEALAEQGYRVQKLTGADSSAERDAKKRRFQETKDIDVFVLSDAGEAGLNLQRGQRLYQADVPATSKSHEQRNGRVDRLAREDPNIELVDLVTDSPFEARAEERVQKKFALRQILSDPAENLDDTGMAKVFSDARRQALAAERVAA